MHKLTVSAWGQITLSKKILRHLRVAPGDKIEVVIAPNREVVLRAARPAGNIRRFIGVLAGKTKKVASLKEIDREVAAGWSRHK